MTERAKASMAGKHILLAKVCGVEVVSLCCFASHSDISQPVSFSPLYCSCAQTSSVTVGQGFPLAQGPCTHPLSPHASSPVTRHSKAVKVPALHLDSPTPHRAPAHPHPCTQPSVRYRKTVNTLDFAGRPTAVHAQQYAVLVTSECTQAGGCKNPMEGVRVVSAVGACSSGCVQHYCIAQAAVRYSDGLANHV